MSRTKELSTEEKIIAIEKELASIQDTLQLLGILVDLVPRLQEEMGVVSVQITSMKRKLNMVQTSMDGKLRPIYGMVRWLESLMSKQSSFSKCNLGF